MSVRKGQIGFSQRIRLEWFERTANLVLAGNDKIAICNALQELLQDKVSIGGEAVRGNREKIITILLKTWLTVPSRLDTLRDKGLRIIQERPLKDHIAVHWGMVLAAYPFWGVVATHTGRLLRLQGTAAAVHVQRRVKEQYGERDTAGRAARRVLRSFIDWGVIKDTQDKGIYCSRATLAIDDPRLIAWLIEAQLHADPKGRSSFTMLNDSLCLFPFTFARVDYQRVLSSSKHLELLPDGSSDEIIGLRTLSPRK